MPSDWEGCIYEVYSLYTYLCCHFDDMLDGDQIRHFDIHYADSLMMGYYEDVAEKYGEEIHSALTPWIREEAKSGRLFETSYWKPFRVPYLYTACYAGYRKLFKYDKYFFQLTIINDHNWNEHGQWEKWKSFGLALYGWENNQVDNNMLLLDTYWKFD